MQLSRNEYGAWLGRYVAAWKSYDADAIGELFSADAVYNFRAGTHVVTGHEAIVEAWLTDRDEPGTWAAHYEPLAVDEEVHVGIGWTRYLDGEEVRDEYSNVFVCRFDEAGHCSEFTEWWMLTTSTD